MNARRTVIVLAAALIGLLPAARAAASPTESEVKLAFTYNIARFVTWPAASRPARSPFRLCVAGGEPIRIATANLSSRRIDNRAIEIVPVGAEGDALRTNAERCDLLYLSAESIDAADTLIAGVTERPVLTVSDADGFAVSGGIVELSRIGDRIAMRINVDASRRAGLAISSQLLALATVVSDEAERGE